MITEINMAITTTKNQDWWLDFGATIHVCNDKSYFKTYTEIKKLEKALMRNHVIVKALRKGLVEINFTSGQKLTLLDIFYG